jgi:hypothetical protein
MSLDPRHGEPVGLNEVAGLTVAFKACLRRAGGRLIFSREELEKATNLHARVEADEERMIVELVIGRPPEVPRFDATAPEPERNEYVAWHEATMPIIAALAVYGVNVNLPALVEKARALNTFKGE